MTTLNSRLSLIICILFCAPILASQDSTIKLQNKKEDSTVIAGLRDSLEKKQFLVKLDSIQNDMKIVKLEKLTDSLEVKNIEVKKERKRSRLVNFFRRKRP